MWETNNTEKDKIITQKSFVTWQGQFNDGKSVDKESFQEITIGFSDKKILCLSISIREIKYLEHRNIYNQHVDFLTE